MSTAFDRAMDEVKRVWEASDHFETKVLQFIGIIAAGALAAAAVLADRIHLHAPYPWYVVALFIVGAVALLAFIFLALRSAIGIAFSGPLDPRLLAEHPEYVRQDDEFEEDMLPFIADAFDQCLNGQELKWRWFRRSLWALSVSVVCFAGALTFCVLAPPTNGAATMSEKNAKPPAESPNPTASDTTTKPVLGPYTVTKGQTIPNEPKTGTFHRSPTKKK